VKKLFLFRPRNFSRGFFRIFNINLYTLFPINSFALILVDNNFFCLQMYTNKSFANKIFFRKEFINFFWKEFSCIARPGRINWSHFITHYPHPPAQQQGTPLNAILFQLFSFCLSVCLSVNALLLH
jgi:hypothetical protein